MFRKISKDAKTLLGKETQQLLKCYAKTFHTTKKCSKIRHFVKFSISIEKH